MTHTNHRQGSLESLDKDYVVFIKVTKGVNDTGAGQKLQAFMRMALKHGAVNAGSGGGVRAGTMLTSSPEQLINRMGGVGSVYTVFSDKKRVRAFINELVKADLGLSVVVSGLLAEVEAMCREAGIRQHTVQGSLGVWGKEACLPEQEIVDITTMCGHGMIASNLVRRMANAVGNGSISLDEAAAAMAKPCVCGVFNPKRAEELLRCCIDKGL
jgi:hypothetical protein